MKRTNTVSRLLSVGLARRLLAGGGLLCAATVALSALAHAQTVTYTYDTCAQGVGRLCAVSDPTGGTTFEYDPRGNVAKTVKTIGVNSFPIRRTYDSLNRLSELTYPTSTAEPIGETIRHSYNSQGLLETIRSVTYSKDYLKNLDYNPLGQMTKRTLGNDLITAYGYADSQTACPRANSFQVCSIKTPETTATLQNLSYTYDEVSNVKAITDSVGSATQAFDYDALDRLTTASSPASPAFAHIYRYDAIGNLVCNGQVGPCPTDTPNAAYPSSGSARPHAVTQVGDLTANCNTSTTATCFGYDNNGNLTSKTTGGVTQNLAWDVENRLTNVRVGASTFGEFQYDDAGQRVLKTAEGVATTYVAGLYECAASCTKHIFAGTQRIALRPVGSTAVTYFLTDHLGSSTVLTNASGGVEQALTYYPYGRTRTNSSPLPGVSYKFTGQEFDDSTQLYYYNARYYDPMIGRFLSADSVDGDPANPQGLNRYAYAANNPLKFVDPSGHCYIATDSTVSCLQYALDISNTALRTALTDFQAGNYGQATLGGFAYLASGGTVAVGLVDQMVAGTYNGTFNLTTGALTGDSDRLLRGFLETLAIFGPLRLFGAAGAATAENTELVVNGSLPSAGGVVRQFEQAGDKVYYRVFSGDADVGAWLTAVPPRSSTWAQEALALPPGNKATMIQEVLVPNGTLLERSRAIAMPEWGRLRGGAEQFELLEPGKIPRQNFGPGRPLP